LAAKTDAEDERPELNLNVEKGEMAREWSDGLRRKSVVNGDHEPTQSLRVYQCAALC
jgi:hypothetical protein